MTDLANLQAPSLDDLEALAQDAYARLPEAFRALCEGVVIRVEDFPDDETMRGDGLRDALRPARASSAASASRRAAP